MTCHSKTFSHKLTDRIPNMNMMAVRLWNQDCLYIVLDCCCFPSRMMFFVHVVPFLLLQPLMAKVFSSLSYFNAIFIVQIVFKLLNRHYDVHAFVKTELLSRLIHRLMIHILDPCHFNCQRFPDVLMVFQRCLNYFLGSRCPKIVQFNCIYSLHLCLKNH